MDGLGQSTQRLCGIVLTALAFTGSGCSIAVNSAAKPSHDYLLQERVNRIGHEIVVAAVHRGKYTVVTWNFAAYEVMLDNNTGGDAIARMGIVRVHEASASAMPNDELAALLSHEIAHVLLEHDATFAILTGTAAIAGVVSVGIIAPEIWVALLVGAGVGGALELVTAAHSRSREEDADALGLSLLCVAGYPGDAMVRMFSNRRAQEIMSAQEAHGGGWFDDHPTLMDRIARIRAIIPQVCRR